MALVQVNFGRSAIALARESIRESMEQTSRSVMAGRMEEAEYKFHAGFHYGLGQALEALDWAEKEVAKEK